MAVKVVDEVCHVIPDENSDDDVIEVVRDDAPIEIFSDDEEQDQNKNGDQSLSHEDEEVNQNQNENITNINTLNDNGEEKHQNQSNEDETSRDVEPPLKLVTIIDPLHEHKEYNEASSTDPLMNSNNDDYIVPEKMQVDEEPITECTNSNIQNLEQSVNSTDVINKDIVKDPLNFDELNIALPITGEEQKLSVDGLQISIDKENVKDS